MTSAYPAQPPIKGISLLPRNRRISDSHHRARRNPFEELPEEVFDDFVDDISLRIKRALGLQPGAQVVEQATDVFEQQEPETQPLYPDLSNLSADVDQSIQEEDVSVLAAKQSHARIALKGPILPQSVAPADEDIQIIGSSSEEEEEEGTIEEEASLFGDYSEQETFDRAASAEESDRGQGSDQQGSDLEQGSAEEILENSSEVDQEILENSSEIEEGSGHEQAVRVALDEESEDEDELQSDQESPYPPIPDSMPLPRTLGESPYKPITKDTHQSTLLDPLPNGRRDAVERIKSSLDAEALDALYGQDEPSDEELEDDQDEDEADDQTHWERIPSELKGKGRAAESEQELEDAYFDEEEPSSDVELEQGDADGEEEEEEEEGWYAEGWKSARSQFNDLVEPEREMFNESLMSLGSDAVIPVNEYVLTDDEEEESRPQEQDPSVQQSAIPSFSEFLAQADTPATDIVIGSSREDIPAIPLTAAHQEHPAVSLADPPPVSASFPDNLSPIDAFEEAGATVSQPLDLTGQEAFLETHDIALSSGPPSAIPSHLPSPAPESFPPHQPGPVDYSSRAHDLQGDDYILDDILQFVDSRQAQEAHAADMQDAPNLLAQIEKEIADAAEVESSRLEEAPANPSAPMQEYQAGPIPLPDEDFDYEEPVQLPEPETSAGEQIEVVSTPPATTLPEEQADQASEVPSTPPVSSIQLAYEEIEIEEPAQDDLAVEVMDPSDQEETLSQAPSKYEISEPDEVVPEQELGLDVEEVTEAEAAEVMQHSTPRLRHNAIQPGVWSPDSPVKFGGTSLEAALREALHDPARSEKVRRSLGRNLIEDSGYMQSQVFNPVLEEGMNAQMVQEASSVNANDEEMGNKWENEAEAKEAALKAKLAQRRVSFKLEEAPLLDTAAEDLDGEAMSAQVNDQSPLEAPSFDQQEDDDTSNRSNPPKSEIPEHSAVMPIADKNTISAKSPRPVNVDTDNSESFVRFDTDDLPPSPLSQAAEDTSAIPQETRLGDAAREIEDKTAASELAPGPRDDAQPEFDSQENPREEGEVCDEEAPNSQGQTEEPQPDIPAIEKSSPPAEESVADAESDEEEAVAGLLSPKKQGKQRAITPTTTERRRSGRLNPPSSPAPRSPSIKPDADEDIDPLQLIPTSNRKKSARSSPKTPQAAFPAEPSISHRKKSSNALNESPRAGSPAAKKRYHRHGRGRVAVHPDSLAAHHEESCGSPSSNAPVTRSHCTYNKMSMPGPRGQTYVLLLPQCATAGQEEKMERNKLQSYGEATLADHEAAIPLSRLSEHQDFGDRMDAKTLTALTRIVGPDLVHECEALAPEPAERQDADPSEALNIENMDTDQTDPAPTAAASDSLAPLKRKRDEEDEAIEEKAPPEKKKRSLFSSFRKLLGKK